MIILGHELIDFEPFYKISSINDLTKTPGNSMVLFNFNENLIKHCKDNKISFSIFANSPIQALIGNSLNAKFIIIPMKIAKEVQDLAEHYLFDSKISILIFNESQIEFASKLKLDCVIFSHAIINEKT